MDNTLPKGVKEAFEIMDSIEKITDAVVTASVIKHSEEARATLSPNKLHLNGEDINLILQEVLKEVDEAFKDVVPEDKEVTAGVKKYIKGTALVSLGRAEVVPALISMVKRRQSAQNN